MADKSWMLNPKAIRFANECIHAVRKKEGVRLKLSQPDFVEQLHFYVDKIQSRELGESYANLISMAGVGNVIRNLQAEPAHEVVAKPIAVGDYTIDLGNETVSAGGREYPKYRDGKVFKGLYRGSPRYQ